MFPKIGGERIALDTETTGLRFWLDRVFGVSLAVRDEMYYWDVRRTPMVLRWLQDVLPTAAAIYAHNLKFDKHMLRESGVIIPDHLGICTMTRAALIDEHSMLYDLDYLGKKCVGVGKDKDIWHELAAVFGGRPTKESQMKNLPNADPELVGRYAKQDAGTCLLLGIWQEGEMESQNLQRVDQLEHELLPVLCDMEKGGVRVDVPAAEKAVYDIDLIVDRERKQLNSAAGFPINPNPSGSIHRLFEPKKDDKGQWVLVDGTIAESTDAGKASISADCLRRMKHPLAGKILKVRKLMKARDTFLKRHVLGHHHNGIIHCNFNQTKSDNEAGTGTGRLSVNSPALQQISARDKEIAAIVRAIFIADEGSKWLSIDWAQVDFRVAAHYVRDQNIMARYAEDPAADFHQITADMTGLPRSPRFAGDPNAKQMNLALAFSMGAGKLAMKMGLPYTQEVVFTERRRCADCAAGRCENPSHLKIWLKPGPEAEAVFNKYHDAIPGMRLFAQSATAVAKERGYVYSLMGRHLRFPGGLFTHKASGLLYQSGAADMQKIKIIECHRVAKELDDRLMLSVHDELNFSVLGDQGGINRLNEVYCDFKSDGARLKLRVPITSSVGIGPNWWEASK